MLTIRVGVDTPRYEAKKPNGPLPAKKAAIVRAMLKAVRMTDPGVLIVQEDVEIEPADLHLAHAVPGTITCLNPALSPMHTCPRAFIVGDQATKDRLIAAWRRQTIQTCYSWIEIPKVYPLVRGTHRGTSWR